MSKSIVLFDLDGTLTEARKPIGKNMITALRELARYAEIGIVTGSGMEYVREQVWPLMNDPIVKYNLHILPCNGTQYWLPPEDIEYSDFSLKYEAYMADEIGLDNFRKILKSCLELQVEMVQQHPELALNGHFIQNRGSMINWCPIGRNANDDDRANFKILDMSERVRYKYAQKLIDKLSKDDIMSVTIKLGGDTSFDIYPNGWDKTFCLRHFEATAGWNHWFVGDRCSELGNDYEIYCELNKQKRAWETAGPEETIEIIDLHLLDDITSSWFFQ
jgi:phosphomannomutase